MSRWKKRKGPPRTFQSLLAGELVDGVISKYRIHGNVQESRAVQAWPQIVGDRIAERCWPYHIREGVLLVAVSNSSWLHQLSFMKEDIVAKINEAAGGETVLVKEVRFELAGRLAKRPSVEGHIVRPRPPPRTRKPPPPAAGANLAGIERDAESVDDPELREIIARTRKRWDL